MGSGRLRQVELGELTRRPASLRTAALFLEGHAGSWDLRIRGRKSYFIHISSSSVAPTLQFQWVSVDISCNVSVGGPGFAGQRPLRRGLLRPLASRGVGRTNEGCWPYL